MRPKELSGRPAPASRWPIEVLLDGHQVPVEVPEPILKQTVHESQVDLRVEMNDPVAESGHPPEVVGERPVHDTGVLDGITDRPRALTRKSPEHG